jgi:GNAT superfamily N-acetyltransferase
VATVRRARADEVVALRHAVLRPHAALTDAVFPGDDGPVAAHFCAEDGDGKIIGVASVWPEAPPWAPESTGAWHLRGMATDPVWRGRGVGAAVLAALTDHVTTAGGQLLWCNARAKAVPFYRRAGFNTRGEGWEVPVIGPHVAMTKELTAAGRRRALGAG